MASLAPGGVAGICSKLSDGGTEFALGHFTSTKGRLAILAIPAAVSDWTGVELPRALCDTEDGGKEQIAFVRIPLTTLVLATQCPPAAVRGRPLVHQRALEQLASCGGAKNTDAEMVSAESDAVADRGVLKEVLRRLTDVKLRAKKDEIMAACGWHSSAFGLAGGEQRSSSRQCEFSAPIQASRRRRGRRRGSALPRRAAESEGQAA
jgi:hypothetical protein